MPRTAPARNVKQQMVDALKQVQLAFRDGGSHIERVAALMDVDKVLQEYHAAERLAEGASSTTTHRGRG